jgi:SAM-dependent methyltransferase
MNKKTQYDYYVDNNIHAVEFKSDALSYSIHERARINLMQNHLGIPLPILRNLDLIEFGPCSGENSVLLAKFGATITLVEPNIAMNSKIIQNFKAAQSENNCIKMPTIINQFVDDYKFDGDYDLIIAENFLHCLQNRFDIVKKLLKHAKSIVIVTYSCEYGYFFEALKRFIHRSLCISAGAVDDESKMQLARELFFKDFSLLTTSRTFESWVLDIILNPCQKASTLDSFDVYHRIASESGFEIYGVSPKWDSRNYKAWYKNVSSENLINEWKGSLSFIITGDSGALLSDSDIQICKRLTPMFLDLSSDVESSANLGQIYELSKGFSDSFSDIVSLILSLASGNHDSIISHYHNSKNCRLWGMPNHHIAFSKSLQPQ